MKNVFYFAHINSIGGVESFFYYLAKKYQKNDITILYKSADPVQIRRLAKLVRVKKFDGEVINCDKAFFNYNIDIIDRVNAKEYIQIIHADYKARGLMPKTHPKITKYIGVSQKACDSFKEQTGLDIELCYNPVLPDKPKKVLNLISATRLTKEKGKNRMVKFASELDKAGIKYIWTIFTNDTDAIDNPNVIYMKPTLEVVDYIANADYLVQLSSDEAYCYSVVEALSVSTPVIVTDCPVFREIGVNETNGFILDFNLNNIPINEIYKGLPEFTYEPKEDVWDKIMAKGKSTYDPNDNKVMVKPVRRYFDTVLQERLTPDSPAFEVERFRGEMLCDVGVCMLIK